MKPTRPFGEDATGPFPPFGDGDPRSSRRSGVHHGTDDERRTVPFSVHLTRIPREGGGQLWAARPAVQAETSSGVGAGDRVALGARDVCEETAHLVCPHRAGV